MFGRFSLIRLNRIFVDHSIRVLARMILCCTRLLILWVVDGTRVRRRSSGKLPSSRLCSPHKTCIHRYRCRLRSMFQLMPRTSRISFAFLTPYTFLFNSLLLALPCIILSVSGHFYVLSQTRIADRRQSRKPQRNHARPNV